MRTLLFLWWAWMTMVVWKMEWSRPELLRVGDEKLLEALGCELRGDFVLCWPFSLNLNLNCDGSHSHSHHLQSPILTEPI